METKKIGFIKFELAREFARGLKLKSKSSWKKINKPEGIPSNPNVVYKDKWISWNDWLDNNNRFCGFKKIINYKDALIISSSIGIKSKKEWEEYLFNNKRDDLPRRPDLYYEEWESWSTWLGIRSKSDRDFMSIQNLRQILEENNIKNKTQFLKFYSNNKNIGIHSSPIKYYNLVSWKELFDKNYKLVEYLEYTEAASFVHKLGLKSQKYWYKLCKDKLIPYNIPKTPNKYYKEWTTWNDWLGHDVTTYKNYIGYAEAVEYLKNINLSSIQEYYDYVISNNINFLPLSPINFYKKEYTSSESFLSYSEDKISYGEKKIKKFLIEKKIAFSQQKKFDECFNINKLLFDFYLPNINTCIEFDGRQHFEIIEYFGGENGYLNRKRNDIIKNDFCEKNGIRLIRISYEDINIIDEILNNLT